MTADDGDAFVEIQAGAGGRESGDWVEMLLGMYRRWAQDKGFEVRGRSVYNGPLRVCLLLLILLLQSSRSLPARPNPLVIKSIYMDKRTGPPRH